MPCTFFGFKVRKPLHQLVCSKVMSIIVKFAGVASLNKVGRNRSRSPLDHSFLAQSMCLRMLWGIAGPRTPEDIPEPSHGRVFREKFRFVYVVKGV